MTGMWAQRLGLRRSERGAVAVEYALLAALVALGIVGSLVSTKSKLNDLLGLVNVRLGVVQQQMSQDTRTAVSTVSGSYMSNNVTYSTTTTTYSDGTKQVVTVPATAGTGAFVQMSGQYGADGALISDWYDYANGSWGTDVYTKMADGSSNIINATSFGDTFIYNARTFSQDGYSIYARHMLSATSPLYQDVVDVIDVSNPSNPVTIAEATRLPSGAVTTTGSVNAAKYLP